MAVAVVRKAEAAVVTEKHQAAVGRGCDGCAGDGPVNANESE